MSKLFKELKRRNVVRVGVAYIVLSWVVLQVGDVLFDMFGTPDWVGKTLAVLLALGFPFACLFAWAFELTPEGIKKTAEVDASDSITHSTGRKLNLVIIAALVVALGYFIWERQGLVDSGPSVAATVDRSIAVLPFVNMSSDEEQEWFADGLTEEILNALARTPDLLVASRTSSFQYKNQNTDISAIAKALGVAHVLEGSVRRGGDRLRVTAQLIRASDGFHLWSETFDRSPEDVIAIQENVAIEIAKALGIHVIVIGSTDLTHYGYNYGFTSHGTGSSAVDWVRKENDRRVIDAMLALEPEKVITEARSNQNACCAGAAATAIETAKHLGADRADELAYTTSYDKSPGDSFVGYVGIVF